MLVWFLLIDSVYSYYAVITGPGLIDICKLNNFTNCSQVYVYESTTHDQLIPTLFLAPINYSEAFIYAATGAILTVLNFKGWQGNISYTYTYENATLVTKTYNLSQEGCDKYNTELGHELNPLPSPIPCPKSRSNTHLIFIVISLTISSMIILKYLLIYIFKKCDRCIT